MKIKLWGFKLDIFQPRYRKNLGRSTLVLKIAPYLHAMTAAQQIIAHLSVPQLAMVRESATVPRTWEV